MERNVLVDCSFLVALLNRRDSHHEWAKAAAQRFPCPWSTCEAAISEAFFVLGPGGFALRELLAGDQLRPAFHLKGEVARVTGLMKRYETVPMSLADACLVRMTELSASATILTTDSDFRIYRRHGRQVVPCILPH